MLRRFLRQLFNPDKPHKWLVPRNIHQSPLDIVHRWYDLEHEHCKGKMTKHLIGIALVYAAFFYLDITNKVDPADPYYAAQHRFGIALLLIGIAGFIRFSNRPFGQFSYVFYKGLTLVGVMAAVYFQFKYSWDYPDRLRLYPPLMVALYVFVARVGPSVSSLAYLSQMFIWVHFSASPSDLLRDANFQGLGILFAWIFQVNIFRDAEILIGHQTQKVLERKQAETELARFLAPSVVDSILSGKGRMESKPHIAHVTVMFVDIVGFTRLTEDRGELIAPLLNDYLSEVSRIVFAYNGAVDKFIGDAVLAFFGWQSNLTPAEQAQSAFSCASEILRAIEVLNIIFERRGDPRIQVRIGLHAGPLLIGAFGSKQRSDFTGIGRVVNKASRIESAADPMSVFVSTEVARHLFEGSVVARGTYMLRGIGEEVLYSYSLRSHQAKDRDVVAA